MTHARDLPRFATCMAYFAHALVRFVCWLPLLSGLMAFWHDTCVSWFYPFQLSSRNVRVWSGFFLFFFFFAFDLSPSRLFYLLFLSFSVSLPFNHTVYTTLWLKHGLRAIFSFLLEISQRARCDMVFEILTKYFLSPECTGSPLWFRRFLVKQKILSPRRTIRHLW